MSGEKEYKISEMAQMMHVSVDTLRYYDHEGLLPDLKRVNGQRIFTEADLPHMQILMCLKNTGLPIREIRRYFQLARQGDATLQQRYELLQEHHRHVEAQMQELQEHMQLLDRKLAFYRQKISEQEKKNG